LGRNSLVKESISALIERLMDEERLMGSVNLSVSKQPVDIRDFDCEMLQRVQKKQSLCKLLEGFF